MMNKITLDNHYKNLIGKKRFWNLSLIVLIFIGVILSSKIIDINGSNLLNGMPRLGDYISQILPSIEINKLFLGSKDQGSIAYWYFNLPKYLKLLFETLKHPFTYLLLGKSNVFFSGKPFQLS